MNANETVAIVAEIRHELESLQDEHRLGIYWCQWAHARLDRIEKAVQNDEAVLKRELDEAANHINNYLQEIPEHPKAHNWLIRNGYKDESYQECVFGQEIVDEK